MNGGKINDKIVQTYTCFIMSTKALCWLIVHANVPGEIGLSLRLFLKVSLRENLFIHLQNNEHCQKCLSVNNTYC